MSSPPPNSHPKDYGSNSNGHGYKTPKGSRPKKALKKRKTKKARRHSPVRQPNFNSTTTTTTTVVPQPNVGSTSTRGRANSFNNNLRRIGNLHEERAMREPGYAEAELKRMKNK